MNIISLDIPRLRNQSNRTKSTIHLCLYTERGYWLSFRIWLRKLGRTQKSGQNSKTQRIPALIRRRETLPLLLSLTIESHVQCSPPKKNSKKKVTRSYRTRPPGHWGQSTLKRPMRCKSNSGRSHSRHLNGCWPDLRLPWGPGRHLAPRSRFSWKQLASKRWSVFSPEVGQSSVKKVLEARLAERDEGQADQSSQQGVNVIRQNAEGKPFEDAITRQHFHLEYFTEDLRTHDTSNLSNQSAYCTNKGNPGNPHVPLVRNRWYAAHWLISPLLSVSSP